MTVNPPPAAAFDVQKWIAPLNAYIQTVQKDPQAAAVDLLEQAKAADVYVWIPVGLFFLSFILARGGKDANKLCCGARVMGWFLLWHSLAVITLDGLVGLHGRIPSLAHKFAEHNIHVDGAAFASNPLSLLLQQTLAYVVGPLGLMTYITIHQRCSCRAPLQLIYAVLNTVVVLAFLIPEYRAGFKHLNIDWNLTFAPEFCNFWCLASCYGLSLLNGVMSGLCAFRCITKNSKCANMTPAELKKAAKADAKEAKKGGK